MSRGSPPDRAARAAPLWLWRVLLPSWRFFDALDTRYLLETRLQCGDEAPSAFAPTVPSLKRGLLALVFSPEHNLRLACHDLVERFVLDLAERGPLPASQLETLRSYARMRQMARFFVSERHGASPDLRYQLRLRAIGADGVGEELFRSAYYALG